VPQSRHRKIQKARKRPRVPHSQSTVNPTTQTAGNRNLRIGAIILVVVIAAAAVAYVVTRRGTTQAGPEVTTASGLKMQDLTVGTGASPRPDQTVTVHYTGWLENGKEFESSRKGRPAVFRMTQLIKGWQEGLSTMKVGGKRRLVIPSNLAYGPAGSDKIPPNSNLTFELELLGIQ
jgi:peptidylprolyl isomerase